MKTENKTIKEKRMNLKAILFALAVLFVTPLILSSANYGEGNYGEGTYGLAICGDSVCDSSESCSTCSADCGICSGGGSFPIDSVDEFIQQINSFTEITPDSPVIISDFDEDFGIKEIQIEVNQDTLNVKFTVRKYDSSPAAVSKEISGSVYRYLEIETENLESNLSKAIITIQIEKTWASENNLEKDQIAMFKFDNSSANWNELPTVFTDEDNEFYFYDIELDSFSFFAISGKIVTQEVDEVGIIEVPKERIDLTFLWWIFGIILIIIIIYLSILILIRKRKEKNLAKIRHEEIEKLDNIRKLDEIKSKLNKKINVRRPGEIKSEFNRQINKQILQPKNKIIPKTGLDGRIENIDEKINSFKRKARKNLFDNKFNE